MHSRRAIGKGHAEPGYRSFNPHNEPPTHAPAGTVRRLAVRLIILSADKELFQQDRCRRLGQIGFRSHPDGPRHEERTPGR